MTARRRRLLSIGHSYVVALNRRLAHELARVGAEQWDVTVVAPKRYPGDLQLLDLASEPGEPYALRGLRTFLHKPAQAFVYAPTLRGILREGWDLVHAWEEPFTFSGAQIAWLLPRAVPLLFATAQNISKNYPAPFNLLERRVVERSQAWVAYGETVARCLLDRPGYAARPHAVIPMGVDTDVFAPDRKAGDALLERADWKREGPPIVGYLGRFVPEKGLSLLLQALERSTRPWRALFIGAGALDGELRAWAARQGERAKVLPPVSHAQVPAALNAFDLLCAPSQTTAAWKEQFGRMISEAFACGVPVLTSDSAECPYTAGSAGVVLPEHDVAAWTRALDEVLERPERRRELGALGRDRAVNAFSWPVVARAHLALFERALSAPR